ncbi:MAG TPA: type 2 lanthipeptide synthetase LanM family protein, partial [Pseudonocardiaceae bacterium]|nr:type 2 lanthipeptide synthetase LanM family protein [Pseudonocardiaceae bacterium]
MGAAGTELPRSWWVRGFTPHERRPDGAAHAPSGPGAPPWAEFVEHVVQHAPAEPVSGGPPAGGVAALTGALTPFVDVTTERLAEDAGRYRDVDQAAVCAGFAKQLGGMLVRLGARTLVTELAAAARAGRLAGATPQDRFADFVGRTGTRCGLVALCAGYPVLARLLGQACRHALDAHRETLRRFAGDRAHIVASLYDDVDPGALTGIDVGQGDHHQSGRSVAILRFADADPVVYKPRSLVLQAHFDGIAAWLNTHVPDLDLRAARCLPMAGYGWQEFVAHLPCADAAGVERFYRRQGALLALLYALDGTDIHFENLIAHADQPVLVDVETLFHPALAPVAAGPTDPAWQRLTASVARTALLPTVMLGERGALDVSGLGGDRDRTLPTDAVDWLDAGTDRMRLVRRPAAFAGGANRPRIDGADADPRQYADALIGGFRAGYEAITTHRQELVDLVRGCAGDTIRILARSTQDYVTLLDESTHPDVLRDAADRDALFDTLTVTAPNQLAAKLAAAETADLWQGDVPVFFATAGRTDLRLSTGEHVDSALDYAGLDMVVGKIGLMSEVDRGEQEWVIRAALATRAGQLGHAAGAAMPVSVAAVLPDRERLLSSACGVADQIVARAHRADTRANWLGMEQVDGRFWTVLSMGAGLADGYCGVALFLAQLGAVTGIARYGELARKAVAPIPLLLAMLAERPEQVAAIGPGGFGGLGGIAYALARMATLLGDAELLTWLATVVPMVGAADAEGDNSVGTGRAGGVAALLAVHAETSA